VQFGRLYQAAPELRVTIWIDGNGEPMDIPLRLDDLGDGYSAASRPALPACAGRTDIVADSCFAPILGPIRSSLARSQGWTY
jgi:hypothetical protein